MECQKCWAFEELWVGGRRESHSGANTVPEPNACAQVLFGSVIQRLSAGVTRLFSAPRPRPDWFSCLELAKCPKGPLSAHGCGWSVWWTTTVRGVLFGSVIRSCQRVQRVAAPRPDRTLTGFRTWRRMETVDVFSSTPASARGVIYIVCENV